MRDANIVKFIFAQTYPIRLTEARGSKLHANVENNDVK